MSKICECKRTPRPSEMWCLDCMRRIFRTWVECSICHRRVSSWYMIEPEYAECEKCHSDGEYCDYEADREDND